MPDTQQQTEAEADPVVEAFAAEVAAEEARASRIEEARAALGEDEDGNPVPEQPKPPVYDDRGNVRPHGTKGARPMTYEERVEVAKATGANPDEAPDKAYEGQPTEEQERRPARKRRGRR